MIQDSWFMIMPMEFIKLNMVTVLTVLLMAGVTYLTRILGYMVLHNRVLSPRAKSVMEAAPGCVLISVIAPYFISGSPADLIALALTIVAAMRFPFLGTVAVGVVAAAVLRQVL